MTDYSNFAVPCFYVAVIVSFVIAVFESHLTYLPNGQEIPA